MIIWSGFGPSRPSPGLLSLRRARFSTVPRNDGGLEIRLLNPIVPKIARKEAVEIIGCSFVRMLVVQPLVQRQPVSRRIQGQTSWVLE
jgi:hypothetical protein